MYPVNTYVAQLLNAAGYSLQGNRKTLEGTKHPDRNSQFEHINGVGYVYLDGHQRQ